MAIPELQGHYSARAAAAKAQAAGRLPQVILVTGEPGIGKQRFALWLAELVLCRDPGRAPCGSCSACRRARSLSHPDLHWFVPVLRPKSGDPARQIDEVREAIDEAIAIRRDQLHYGPPDGMAIHGVASARLILRTAALTTVEGGKRVIIIGEAERLVSQDASPEAANALLKFLEEPPASSLVVLTTTEPTRVLPTIRSRAVPVRLGRLAPAEVERGLRHAMPDLSPAEYRDRVAAAEGSIGRALSGSTRATRGRQALQLLEAAGQGAARFERTLAQPPWQARGEFTALLDGVAHTLRDAARALATGQSDRLPATLRRVRDPARLVAALDSVESARDKARGNINPQLLLATLSGQLAEALWA
jgi:DNA polymerase-3 subunit delta'